MKREVFLDQGIIHPIELTWYRAYSQLSIMSLWEYNSGEPDEIRVTFEPHTAYEELWVIERELVQEALRARQTPSVESPDVRFPVSPNSRLRLKPPVIPMQLTDSNDEVCNLGVPRPLLETFMIRSAAVVPAVRGIYSQDH